MSTEFFSRIKNFGSLRSRDFSKILAKGNSLKKSDGAEAVAAFLRENLGEAAEKVDSRQLDSYVACRILLAECQAECGINGNSPRQALEGIQALLKLPASYPSLIQDGSSRWSDLLLKAENFFQSVLDPKWVPNSNKSAFVPELAALAGSWIQLKKAPSARRVCQMGFGVFPGDSALMLVEAEAHACVGDFPSCLESLKSVIRCGANLQSPGKIIALLELVQGTTDPNTSALAGAMTGEVYGLLGRWDQALTAAHKALAALGEKLEDHSVEALLNACCRTGKLEEFERHAQTFLRRGLSAESLARIGESVKQLLAGAPQRKRLWLVAGAIALRTDRAQDAVMAFRQAFVLDRALASEVVAWYQAVGAYTTAEGSLCVNLAQVLFRAGQTDESLKVLARLDSDGTTPTQLDEAVALCREVVDRLPEHLEARACLVRLLLRQGDVEGALAAARRMLTLAGAAQAVVQLCVEVARKAQQDANEALLMPALQLEIEAQQKVPDLGAALDQLETLSRHPAATGDRLLWAAETLRAIVAEAAFQQRARIVLGDVLWRLQSRREAAEHFFLVLGGDVPAALLERGCAGLAQAWSQAADPKQARAMLASGWLRLGKAGEAREPLFACLEQKLPQCPQLLELLAARLGEQPTAPEWQSLSLEADLKFGDEARLAAAVARWQRLLEQNSACAEVAEESARRLAEKIQSPETRKAACLLQLQAQAVSGQFARLSSTARATADAHPDWRLEIARVVEVAGAKSGTGNQAQVCLILGQLLSVGGRAEAEKAAALFAQAAQLDLKAWGETVVAEASKLAHAPEGFAGAILVAFQSAIRLGKGAVLSTELLRLLDQLSEAEVREALRLMEKVLKTQPASVPSWLVKARGDTRLRNLAGALTAYQRIFQLPTDAFGEDVLNDLRSLQQQEPANADLFLVFIDALLRRNDVPTARAELVKRVSLFPGEATECLQRLVKLQKRSDHSWENLSALAEAFRAAGQPVQAVPIWNQVLGAPGIDWARCATGLQQLCIALPKDFGAGALLVRAETHALPVDQVKSALQRLERILELPEKSEEFLKGLLDDCAVVEKRAKDREDVARLLGFRRAEIYAFQQNHAAAAEQLAGLVRRWPADGPAVSEFCQRALAAGGSPIYLFPQARAAFVAGDFALATDSLRKLVERLPEQRGNVRELCHEYFGKAQGQSWELIQMLRADLAVQAGDYRTAAQFCLALADRAPNAAAAARERLVALIGRGVEAPEVHLALADLELGGKPENISAAFEVLKQFLARDVDRHFALTLDYLRHLKKQFPDQLETRMHLVWTLFKSPEPALQELGAEVKELFRDFGKDGAAAFVEFCGRHLTACPEHAPFWYLRCAAHEVLEDLAGSLQCLNTLIGVDLTGQAATVKQRAATYRQPGCGPAPVVIFLAKLASQTSSFGEAAGLYAEAVELPEADLNHIRDGLRPVLETEPANSTAICALARCEWKAGNPAAAAAGYQLAARQAGAPPLDETLKELCRVFPHAGKCWFVRTQYSFNGGDFADAFASLQHICPSPDLERDEQILAWKMLADCYARDAKFDEAANIVRRVVEADPTDDSAARRLISLYFEKNTHRLAQAKAALEQPDGATPGRIVEYAGLLKALGDYAEAVRWFQKVPRNHALAGSALLEGGKCHLALNQCHLAAVAFKGVLILGPTTEQRREALYHLGLAHARLLEFEDAVRVFEELCVEDPGYRDAAEQLRRNCEHLQAGPVLRMAEVPFDLLTVWKQFAAEAKPAPSDAAPKA